MGFWYQSRKIVARLQPIVSFNFRPGANGFQQASIMESGDAAVRHMRSSDMTKPWLAMKPSRPLWLGMAAMAPGMSPSWCMADEYWFTLMINNDS